MKAKISIRARRILKNLLISSSLLLCAFLFCLWLVDAFGARESAGVLFVFAVFLISMLTDSYVYGIVSAFFAVLAVNHAFAFPYFSFNFTLTENLISAGLLIVVAVLTSTLTMKLRQHEAERREIERERLRANLLRAVSHDLRTPLTTIYASASALLEDETLNEEKRRRIVVGIKEDAEWLTRMVENLLSVTRIGEGQVKLVKTPTVPDELVDSVIGKFKKRYPSYDVQIELPTDIVFIPMDPMLIEQVLLNLLENAVQHAAGMTQLWLRVSVRGRNAVFEVEDNGCGIPPDELPTIFSGMQKPQDAPSDGSKHSTGIGLSVCATIIRVHGGSISARNAPGGGAIFRFTLQIEEADHEQQQV